MYQRYVSMLLHIAFIHPSAGQSLTGRLLLRHSNVSSTGEKHHQAQTTTATHPERTSMLCPPAYERLVRDLSGKITGLETTKT